MKNKLNYFMVNVNGNNGYSFMVTTSDDTLTEEQVGEICLDKQLFDYDADFQYCTVSSMVFQDDIEFFKDCTYNID